MRELLFFLMGLSIGGLVGLVVASRDSHEFTRKLGAALSVLEARVKNLEGLPINWAAEIREIVDLAADMRGSYVEGDKWLSTSVSDLGGSQPGDLIRTRAGAEKVLAFLKQWKNGGRLPAA
jgi:uncharacterized protein (DUF2384 family)